MWVLEGLTGPCVVLFASCVLACGPARCYRALCDAVWVLGGAVWILQGVVCNLQVALWVLEGAV